MSTGNTTRRATLFRQQEGKCHYCEIQMTKKRDRHDSITVDHIIPESHGGTRHRKNIVGACWACNNARGTTPYEEFKARVAHMGRPTVSPGAKCPKQWMIDRKAKEARRAKEREIKDRPGHWSTHMAAERPYLRDIDRHPVLAEALIDAGLAERPDEKQSGSAEGTT